MGAALQGGLAKLWRADQECDHLASARYIDRQTHMWLSAYPEGLDDAKKKIDRWFEERELQALLTYEGVKDMDGVVVEQPNEIAQGGAWLVYGYKHAAMSDTTAWTNNTGWAICSMAACGMEHNAI